MNSSNQAINDQEINLDAIDKNILEHWKRRCENKLIDCIFHYQKHHDSLLPVPQLTFDLDSRRVAGQACYPDTIRLNLSFLIREKEHFVDNVVVHEFAHYVIFHQMKIGQLKGRIQPHGKEWKNMMLFFGVSPDTYHSYDIDTEGLYSYSCPCKHEHYLSITRHRRVYTKYCNYLCNHCGKALFWNPSPSEKAAWEERFAKEKAKKKASKATTSRSTRRR